MSGSQFSPLSHILPTSSVTQESMQMTHPTLLRHLCCTSISLYVFIPLTCHLESTYTSLLQLSQLPALPPSTPCNSFCFSSCHLLALFTSLLNLDIMVNHCHSSNTSSCSLLFPKLLLHKLGPINSPSAFSPPTIRL